MTRRSSRASKTGLRFLDLLRTLAIAWRLFRQEAVSTMGDVMGIWGGWVITSALEFDGYVKLSGFWLRLR